MKEMIKQKIRTVPDFPKKGIMFRDITTLLEDPVGFKICIDDFYKQYKDKNIDLVVGIDSRGFILGGALAYLLGIGFVPVRKKGKLPSDTIEESYDLEYGSATLEIHKDAIKKGKRVLIIDDLLATGGTALCAGSLVKKLGGDIVEYAFIVDLPELKGGERIKKTGASYYAQVAFDGH